MWVDGRALRDVGDGSILRARAGQPRHRGADLTHVVGVGANLHVGNAGDHRGNVDRHEQVIWARVAFVEDVGTADVRIRRSREQQHDDREDRGAPRFIPYVVVTG